MLHYARRTYEPYYLWQYGSSNSLERRMNFGERIRDLRKAHALTQRTLAEKLGVDFTYLSKIENGRLDQPPSEALIRRMAEVLGADPEELLDLSGQFDAKALQEVVA